MKSKYLKANSVPGYWRLRQSANIIGTWDDHDYGLNDAGNDFSHKTTNQRLLLDFLHEPLLSPRRNQQGVYASYTFGPLAKQVKVILLDTRYHRDPLSSDGTILGNPPSAITLIGSSIQVVSNLSATTGPLFYMESWGRFPKERNRLFNLIADSKRDGVIFISGDVHFGEITRYDCAPAGYPLYDITSSGLTQAVEKAVPPPFHFLVRFLAWLTPTTMRIMDKNCRYSSCTFGQPNFGAIEIDWAATPVKVRIEIRDVKGLAVAGVNISLSELQSGNINSSHTVRKWGGIRRHCSLEVSLPWIIRYRLAIIFYALLAVLLVGLTGVIYVVTLACRRKCKRD